MQSVAPSLVEGPAVVRVQGAPIIALATRVLVDQGGWLMRIHIFSSSTRFTGGRQVLYTHGNALAERGHEVTLFVTADPGIGWMKINFAVQRMGWRDIPKLPGADLCLLERPRFIEPLAAAGVGIPVLFAQGFEARDLENRLAGIKGRWTSLFETLRLRARLRAIDRACRLDVPRIAIHKPLADALQHRYGHRVWLVPNGLPDGVFAPGDDPRPDGRTVLVVGSSDTQCKRIGDALEAVRLLKSQLPGTRLVRISTHPMRPMEKIAGLTDEFHQMVPRERMAQFYRQADVLLMTSDDTEGFGLPVLEAMACGTPVVATDIPALRGFDYRSDYARFVAVAHPDLLAGQLLAVLGSLADRQQLRARGLEVAAQYTMQRSLDAMSRALDEIRETYAPR